LHAPHEARLTTPAADVLLRAEGLTRRFGARTAVDGVEFEGRRGEILGLLGPNGAGKTTTLRMLAGLLAPSSGRVLLAGADLARDVPSDRRTLAYLPEQAALYDEMTVSGYLRFIGRVWGLRRGALRAAVDGVLDELEIADVRNQVIGTLSRGYRQRVAIAGALVHDPEVLLLDEPTSGLDPRQVVDVRRLLARLGRSRLVVFSTHILSEASQLCDRVLIVHLGRQVALGAPSSLERRVGTRSTRVVAVAPAEQLRQRLLGIDGVSDVVVQDAGSPVTLLVTTDDDRRTALSRAVHDAGWELVELVEETPDLEAVFLELTEVSQDR
jgi:ABC-2 type transport system ATP-binding protein